MKMIKLFVSVCFFTGYLIALPAAGNNGKNIQAKNYTDSLPKTNDSTVTIPFEYKQSALNFDYTFKLMDSVSAILLTDTLITLSIDGYSYFDEGNDNICYWLSQNRALAVKSYIMGRGVDSLRIKWVKGRSKFRSIERKAKKEAIIFNCTADIIINYPIPEPPPVVGDMDEDGIPDDVDSCRNEYGDKAHNGCPERNAIIVPFEPQQSSLYSSTYKVLDSVITLLHKDPSLTISIEGHAYKKEGVKSLCEKLARERADIVKRYLLTRNIGIARIEAVQSFGDLRPITAGRNSWEVARNCRAAILLLHH